jgi:hypothetical protein
MLIQIPLNNDPYLKRSSASHLDELHNTLLIGSESGDLTDDLADEADTGGLLSLGENSARAHFSLRGHMTLVQAEPDSSLLRASHFDFGYFPAMDCLGRNCWIGIVGLL